MCVNWLRCIMASLRLVNTHVLISFSFSAFFSFFLMTEITRLCRQVVDLQCTGCSSVQSLKKCVRNNWTHLWQQNVTQTEWVIWFFSQTDRFQMLVLCFGFGFVSDSHLFALYVSGYSLNTQCIERERETQRFTTSSVPSPSYLISHPWKPSFEKHVQTKAPYKSQRPKCNVASNGLWNVK